MIAESDHISAALDLSKGLLKPEDVARLTELTRMLENINKESKHAEGNLIAQSAGSWRGVRIW